MHTLFCKGGAAIQLKDIARIAKVSPSTVTIVLNGKPGVSDSTRQLLTALLEEHGYTVSPAKLPAESTDRRLNIHFIKYRSHAQLVEGNAGFVSRIIDAVSAESRLLNCDLTMMTVDRDSWREVAGTLSESAPDGILLLATEADEETFSLLEGLTVPIVAVDNPMAHLDCNCVDMNNEEATMKITRHLAGLGHGEIGYFYNDTPSDNCRARFNAYRHALDACGLPYHSKHIFRVPPTLEGACEAVSRQLSQGRSLPSAMMATNDTIAIGALNALKQHGIQVPRDVSVVGFDDISFAAASDPPLTTMRVSCKNIGAWAVRLLHDHIQYPHSPTTKIMVSPTLVERASTAPPQ